MFRTPCAPVHGTATYRCDDTISCVMQFWPPDDENMCSKHVEVEGGLCQPMHETATCRCDDTRSCVMQFWPPDDENMCSKHVEARNKLIVKQKFCASSWLITEINDMQCRLISALQKHVSPVLIQIISTTANGIHEKIEEQTTHKRTEIEDKNKTTYRHPTCFQTSSCCRHHSLLEQKRLSLNYVKVTSHMPCTWHLASASGKINNIQRILDLTFRHQASYK